MASFDCVQALKQASERKKAKPAPGLKAFAGAAAEEDAGSAQPSPASAKKPPNRMKATLADEGEAQPSRQAVKKDKLPAGTSASQPTAPQTSAPQPKVAGRAVMPTKRLIVCYHCGYSHTSTGQMHVTYCPKCRKIFETDDITVKSPRKGDLFTIGDMFITEGAVFDAGAKIAGKVVKIGADISNVALLTATESLVLLSGAKIGGVKLDNHGKISVPAGEMVEMDAGFACSELDIAGELRADVRVERGATLRAGAVLGGVYSGPSIEIEDGATISAEMRLTGG